MKLGFMQLYNEFDWASYTIDQAMLLCDKLIITEGSHFSMYPNISERSDDGTLDIIADKIKAYPGSIKLINTIRIHNKWQANHCANYNRALNLCDIGDYFLRFDADEFYFEELIEMANDLMNEGKADCLITNERDFVFGFKWVFNVNERSIFFKRTPELHFVPSCKPLGYGPNTIKDKSINAHHYTFVKSRERIRMRMMTSGFYKGMLEWFDANWDAVELGDGKPFDFVSEKYIFERYEGTHPAILDGHPWRHIEDTRNLVKEDGND